MICPKCKNKVLKTSIYCPACSFVLNKDRALALVINEAEYLKKIRAAAEAGKVSAAFKLGRYYDNGFWPGKIFAADRVEAAKWYRFAAERGHVKAQEELGLFYLNGIGVEQNLLEAFKWFDQAALKGNIEGCYCLGTLLKEGEGGIPQNIPLGLEWIRKAAEGNHALALYEMRIYCANGYLVPRDHDLALSWCRKAVKGGSSLAKEDLKILTQGLKEGRISPEAANERITASDKWYSGSTCN